jgi:hypothetical protein
MPHVKVIHGSSGSGRVHSTYDVSTPTTQDIVNAQANLNNMIVFNTQFYSYGNAKILNAYGLLNQTDNQDLGLQVGLNLLSSAMSALGGTAGFGGALAGNFMASMVAQYATVTPPCLSAQFADLISRFEQTSLQCSQDLQNLYQNTASCWNNTYSGQLITPFSTSTISGSVSDLATPGLFPDLDDPMFTDLLSTATYALDQSIWSVLLPRFVITQYQPSTEYPTSQFTEQDMENNANSFYSVHPAYYNTWVYESAKKSKNDAYWLTQSNLGSGYSTFSDGSLNDDACQYLFIDGYNGIVINPSGLFDREFVFTSLNIPQKTHIFPSPVPPQP